MTLQALSLVVHSIRAPWGQQRGCSGANQAMSSGKGQCNIAFFPSGWIRGARGLTAWFFWGWVISASCFCLFPFPALAQDLNPQQVQEAIDRAVHYLKVHQRRNGAWPAFLRWDTTPLVALALLNAGVPPEDESLARALNYLRSKRYERTYLVSLQTMVFCHATPQRDLNLIRRNAAWLAAHQITKGPKSGTWSYPPGSGDKSNTQFAMLALWEAERTLQRFGIPSPVSRHVWRRARLFWQRTQNPDGSWGYLTNEPGTGSMTCAGIASLIIAADRLGSGAARVEGQQVQCCGRYEPDVHIQRGLRWLARNFTVHANPNSPGGRWWLYYLYGLERVGRLTAHRKIGQHDWYREGAAVLIQNQDRLSGFWRGVGPEGNHRIVSTALALLFLTKGRRPVLVAKLRYGTPNAHLWNSHPNDVGNLTRYVELRWGRDLTWEVYDMNQATAADYLQAPVLFLSGRGMLSLSQEQVEQLRAYLDRGGFLFAEACCDRPGEFDDAFRLLMERVFPEPELQLRRLSPDHEVWFMEEKVGPEYAGHLWGVNVGCRTAVIYCDTDLSCYWELSRWGRERKLPQQVQQRVQSALSLGLNVVAYATGRKLKYKDMIPRLKLQTARSQAVQRAMLVIPKLRHPGSWNAAPGALLSLQRYLKQELGLIVPTDQRTVSLTDQELFGYHMLFMHGRRAFQFTQEEREALRKYLQNGGFILADAVCASEEFAQSFRREMALLFPGKKLQRIPPDHKLFTPAYGGFDLRVVRRRELSKPNPSQPVGVQEHVRQVPPELEGLELEPGRYCVIFSPLDLSCALESQGVVPCRGYVREDAARLAINIVLYSLQE